MPSSNDSEDERRDTSNHAGYEGLTDEEADKVSYWADWVELNAVAPSQPPRPPPNFSNGYLNSDSTGDNNERKAKL